VTRWGKADVNHLPVLAKQVLHWLQPADRGLYIDCTLGLGGHAEQILQASAPSGRVLAFEWDNEAAVLARKRLKSFGDRLICVQDSYVTVGSVHRQLDLPLADGLLVDLGVSSLQFDRGERGFSFQVDAVLDMRMNREIQTTAADLVNQLAEEQLADIFYHYGEERQARRIAARIVREREKTPVQTTGQLVEIIRRAVPARYRPARIHEATKVFQALRIAVNRELDNLARLLAEAPAVLKQGARICTITFHSLEDRIVKQAVANSGELRFLISRPIGPDRNEIMHNRRARSAKLRVAERC